jgi:hypothetical protein
MATVKLDLKRCNMYLSASLIERVDAYALKMGLNRTAAISSLIGTALDQQDAIKTLGGVIKAYGVDEIKQA